VGLHTDIPTSAQIEQLLRAQHPASASIYLPTEPASSGEAERIAFRNLTGEVLSQLAEVELARGELDELRDAFETVTEDGELWRQLARSLAVFVSPGFLRTFRLPNRLVELAEVSDRFHLKPLLRAVTFPQVGYVLALAEGSVRLVEFGPDLPPVEVNVADLPRDAASAVGKSSINDPSPSGRIQGGEGQKVRLRQYARSVDEALRPVLHGQSVPLIVAAAQPMDSIFRSVCSYPHLAPTGIQGSPDRATSAELSAEARGVLDDIHAATLRDLRGLYEQRAGQHRTATDLVDVARAATNGAVDTLFADMDEVVPGTVDEAGAVTFLPENDAVAYGVSDEIARRVLLNSGTVLAVRRDDVPGGGSLAAILRYPQ